MEAIQYTRHGDIDKNKWDALITASPNGFIYSRSFFLDAMCNWDALVLGDYEWVMPLPYRRKAGFTYSYTPFFTGQLGITGKEIPSAEICNQFINAIPASFSFIDLQLNEGNELAAARDIKQTARTNFIIPLDKDHAGISSGYNKDARKNIRQAAAYGLKIEFDIPADTVFSFYKNAYGHLARQISTEDYKNFSNACAHALANGLGFTCAVKNEKDETVAAAFFAKDNKRIYYLLGAPSAAGKKINATHFLIDEVLKQYAGSGLTFDFEGSDIPSVAAFYKKFGPQKKTYPHIVVNRLPFWIKWIKKG